MKKIIIMSIMVSSLLQYAAIFPSVQAVNDITVPKGTFLPIYTDEDIQKAADNLFDNLNPESEDTQDIYKLYKNKQYKEALILFRKYFVDRMRAAPVSDLLPNRGAYSWNFWYDQAEVFVGRMSISEFNSKHHANRADLQMLEDAGNFLKVLEPDINSEINWVAKAKPAYITFAPGNTLAFLAARYCHTGDTLYLKRYFQLFNDFALNYRSQLDAIIEGMTPEGKISYAKTVDNRMWLTEGLGSEAAGSNLSVAQRASYLIGSLAGICKGLPPVDKEPDYSFEFFNTTINTATFTDQLEDQTYDLIDPIRLANISSHIIKNEIWRISSYLTFNAIPNQLLHGLSHHYYYMCMFKDFTLARENEDLLTERLNKVLTNFSHPDGGILEKSFNYNRGDYNTRKNIVNMGSVMAPEIAAKLGDVQRSNMYWEKLMEAYISPVGIYPNIGNESNAGAAAIWKEPEKKKELEDKLGEKDYPYSSVYFPFSGYGAMRSGWDVDALYLAFFNNNQRSTGHYVTGTNGIFNLTAFGRTMLISGGAPWYGRSYVSTHTEFLESGYDEINGYFSEDSTRKVSTIMVNGKSQAARSYIFNADGTYSSENVYGTKVEQAPNTTLGFRWLSGDNYDFGEGLWDGGYSHLDTEVVLQKYAHGDPEAIELDATHFRQITYVKQADLWVVLDEVANKLGSKNEYTQIWNFAPYENASAALTGYQENQVVTDSKDRAIFTQDPEGPNLFINSFSAKKLKYEKYYGYWEPGITGFGWSKGGKDIRTGLYAPRADIHVKWTDEKRGDISQVATVLAPSKNADNPIIRKKELSTEDTTSFEITTGNNVTIRYFSSPTLKMYKLDNIEVMAKSLLITQEQDKISGLVLDCEFFAINNIAPRYNVYKNFEFLLNDRGLLGKTIESYAPQTFHWVSQDENGLVPIYHEEEIK